MYRLWVRGLPITFEIKPGDQFVSSKASAWYIEQGRRILENDNEVEKASLFAQALHVASRCIEARYMHSGYSNLFQFQDGSLIRVYANNKREYVGVNFPDISVSVASLT